MADLKITLTAATEDYARRIKGKYPDARVIAHCPRYSYDELLRDAKWGHVGWLFVMAYLMLAVVEGTGFALWVDVVLVVIAVLGGITHTVEFVRTVRETRARKRAEANPIRL